MAIESYDPSEHEWVLRSWAEQMGVPFDARALSARGFVAVDADGPVMMLFAYHDPTSKVAFLDNLVGAPGSSSERRRAALRDLVRVVQNDMRADGCICLFFLTGNPRLVSALRESGIVPYASDAAYYAVRLEK